MPNVARGRAREQLTGVELNSYLLYCFKTSDQLANGITGKSSADLQNELGHQIITPSTNLTGSLVAILGANAPKPARVSFRDKTTGRSVSTYCATSKLVDARKAGWALAKAARARGVIETRRRLKVYVELFGLMYVFPMDDVAFQQLGQLCGIKDATSLNSASEIQRVIYGTSAPRPGTAFFQQLSGGGSVSGNAPNFSCFYDPTKSDDVAVAAKRITSAIPPAA